MPSRDPSRIDHLVRQFVSLVANETSIDRLAHYHKDVTLLGGRMIRRCTPATAARLIEVLHDRFVVGSAPKTAPGTVRRRPQPAKPAAPREQGRAVTLDPGMLVHEAGPDVWSSAEWRAQVVSWLDEQLAAAGIERTGELDSLHTHSWATVLRAPTTNGPVWLKAVGPATSVEVGLYQLLPCIAPHHILTPIATDITRGWMMLADGGLPLGSLLAGTELVEALVTILPRYGQLQRDLVSHVDDLLSLGVKDMRPSIMPHRFESALLNVSRHVERRGSKFDQASYQQLAGLEGTFTEWCNQLNAGSIDASLDHTDLHAENILVADESTIAGAKFFD
jgi:hypothetical protein